MNISDLPTPALYWARPAPKENGNADINDIFAAVGQALSAWEGLEGVVVDLFVLFVQSYSPAARRAYGSIMSQGGRREAMFAASESCFLIHKVTAEDVAKFNKFIDHWANAVGRRNEIAHGVVTNVKINETERGHFLCPAGYNTKKNRPSKGFFPDYYSADDEFSFLPGDYRYTKEDIAHFIERFNSLYQAAFYFHLHLIRTYPRMWDLSLPPQYPGPDVQRS
jgi:hypothetical protein